MSDNCTLTGGKSLSCRNNSAGVETIDITPFAKHSYDYSGNKIIGTTSGSPVEFDRLEQELQEAEIKEVPVKGGFYETSVNLMFRSTGDKNLDDELRTLILRIHSGRFIIVGKDNNGHKRLYGQKKGLRTSEGDGGLGKALEDLNGYTMTLSCRQKEPARLVGTGGAVAFTFNDAPV